MSTTSNSSAAAAAAAEMFVAVLAIFLAVSVPSSLGGGGLVGAAPVVDDDEVLNGVKGLEVFVTKRGAYIRVQRQLNSTASDGGSGSDSGFGKTGAVEVFLDTIEELNANLGNLSGNHTTQSFANVDFNAARSYNVSLQSSDVKADCLNCSATIDKGYGVGAKISMAVCAIKSNGILDMDGEKTSVSAGQLKITLTVADWPWETSGNQLAVDVVIKVPSGRTVSRNSTSYDKPEKFSLGVDSFMEFSRKVLNDNAWTTMPDDYPRFTARGANNEFRLVLGAFDRTSAYDPNLEVGYLVDGATRGGRAGGGFPLTATTLLLSVVSLLLAGTLGC